MVISGQATALCGGCGAASGAALVTDRVPRRWRGDGRASCGGREVLVGVGGPSEWVVRLGGSLVGGCAGQPPFALRGGNF